MPPRSTAAATPAARCRGARWPRAATPAATAPVAAPAVRKLDPHSEAYANRMDDRIPTHLYAEASHCYKGGLQRDQRIDLTYRIRVDNGQIRLSDVQVVDRRSTIRRSSAASISTVAGATWRDDELPDVQETGDLFMRVAGFSAYLANADDDSSGGEAMN